MPAHIKASLLGPSLSLPVAGGRLALGTWQGIYLCEHRDRGGSRSLSPRCTATTGRASGASASGPSTSGSRFSAKALAPSWASSEPNTGAADLALFAHASSSVQLARALDDALGGGRARAARC